MNVDVDLDLDLDVVLDADVVAVVSVDDRLPSNQAGQRPDNAFEKVCILHRTLLQPVQTRYMGDKTDKVHG